MDQTTTLIPRAEPPHADPVNTSPVSPLSFAPGSTVIAPFALPWITVSEISSRPSALTLSLIHI